MNLLDLLGGLVCRAVGYHRWYIRTQRIGGVLVKDWPRCTRCGALRDGAR